MIKTYLKYELRKVFSNIPNIILSCLIPLFLLFIITSSPLDNVFKPNEIKRIKIAIFNEDGSIETKLIINHLMNNDSVNDIIELNYQSSIEDGLKLIDSKEVVAFIYIPKGLQNGLYSGKSQKITYYSSKKNEAVSHLIYLLLNEAIGNVNQVQKSADLIYYSMKELGYNLNTSISSYNEVSKKYLLSIANKNKVYLNSKNHSIINGVLNLEFYIVSTILLCAFFVSLPLCRITSREFEKNLLMRGNYISSLDKYLIAKIIANSIYIFIPLIITSVFGLFIFNSQHLLLKNIFIILGVILIISTHIASLVLFISSIQKNMTKTIWSMFTYALLSCGVAGLIIPVELMPRGLNILGEITLLPSFTRLLSYSLFGGQTEVLLISLILSLIINMIIWLITYNNYKKYLVIL